MVWQVWEWVSGGNGGSQKGAKSGGKGKGSQSAGGKGKGKGSGAKGQAGQQQGHNQQGQKGGKAKSKTTNGNFVAGGVGRSGWACTTCGMDGNKWGWKWCGHCKAGWKQSFPGHKANPKTSPDSAGFVPVHPSKSVKVPVPNQGHTGPGKAPQSPSGSKWFHNDEESDEDMEQDEDIEDSEQHKQLEALKENIQKVVANTTGLRRMLKEAEVQFGEHHPVPEAISK